MSPTGKLKKFIVKIEINHSTDFNDAYPKSAKEGDANYSGGKKGADSLPLSTQQKWI